MGEHLRKNWFYFLLLLLALLFPLLGPSRLVFTMLILSGIWSIATLGLNLILGYTGQASLAHGAFFGIGAYAVGIMTTRLGLSFWIALPLAALLSAVIGFLIGLPTLRTKGAYFAISTLAFGIIVFVIAGNWVALTGGHMGLPAIPRPNPIPLPLAGELNFTSPAARYYLVLFFLLLTLWVMHRVVFSLQGYSFMAIRNNENLAEAVGINTFRNKLLSFVVANFFAGLAGGLYAMQLGALSPFITHHVLTFNLIIYLILGGVATLAGPIVGAITVPFIVDALFAIGPYRMVIFGILLIVSIIYFPRGLMGGLTSIWNRATHYYRHRKEGARHAAKS